jgi:hypothetical protein
VKEVLKSINTTPDYSDMILPPRYEEEPLQVLPEMEERT